MQIQFFIFSLLISSFCFCTIGLCEAQDNQSYLSAMMSTPGKVFLDEESYLETKFSTSKETVASPLSRCIIRINEQKVVSRTCSELNGTEISHAYSFDSHNELEFDQLLFQNKISTSYPKASLRIDEQEFFKNGEHFRQIKQFSGSSLSEVTTRTFAVSKDERQAKTLAPCPPRADFQLSLKKVIDQMAHGKLLPPKKRGELHSMNFGPKIHGSCLDKKINGQKFDEVLSQTLSSSLTCLNRLQSPVSDQHLLGLINVIRDRKVLFRCDFIETGTRGIAGAKDDKDYPSVSLNPTYFSESDESETRRTILHELMHETGPLHGTNVEYAYACEVCCFPLADDQPALACDICTTASSERFKPSYIEKLIRLEKSGASNKYSRMTIDTAMSFKPGNHELQILRVSSFSIDTYNEALAAAIKEEILLDPSFSTTEKERLNGHTGLTFSNEQKIMEAAKPLAKAMHLVANNQPAEAAIIYNQVKGKVVLPPLSELELVGPNWPKTIPVLENIQKEYQGHISQTGRTIRNQLEEKIAKTRDPIEALALKDILREVKDNLYSR